MERSMLMLSSALWKGTYVSDCLKSLWSTKESKELVPQLTNLSADAGFRLHKWMSKDQETMKVISPGDRASSIADLNLDHLPVDRALAIKWDVQEDLMFLTQFSRRSLYCELNNLYDTKFRRFVASHKVLGAGGWQQTSVNWDATPVWQQTSVDWNATPKTHD